MPKWLKASFVAGLLCASVAVAEPYKVEFPATDASTNATAVAITNSINLQAWVNTVDLDLSGYASPTVDVSIATTDGRTVLSLSGATADGVYAPRDVASTTAGVTISNESSMIPLVAEKLVVNLSNANSTGVTAAVTVYMKR